MSRLIKLAPVLFVAFLASAYGAARYLYPANPEWLTAYWMLWISIPALAISFTLIMIGATKAPQSRQEQIEDGEQYGYNEESLEKTQPDLTSADPKTFLTNVSIQQLQREDRLKVSLKNPVNIHIKGKNDKEVDDFDLLVEMRDTADKTGKPEEKKPAQKEPSFKPLPQT